MLIKQELSISIKTGVLLNPLGQKKESRQGTVSIQTSDIKLDRIEKGEQSSVIYDQKAAEQFIKFTSVGCSKGCCYYN